MASQSDRIRERIIEIDDELEGLERRIALLRAELAELNVAQRVLARFDGDDGHNDIPGVSEPATAVFTLTPESQRSQKPATVPTIPDMILKVLTEAHSAGLDGLEPKAILAEVRKRWWPGAPSESIGPIAWRMARDGRLRKSGSLYGIPEGEELRPSDPDDLSDLGINLEPEGR